MKRLTFDGNFCDIAMCVEVRGGSFCEDGFCSQRKTWERLKAIEDILGDEYDLDRLREQVEKVWRGEWIDAYPGTSSCKCTKCGAVQECESTFCCHCGAPMTDEAVEMVMERINKMEETENGLG